MDYLAFLKSDVGCFTVFAFMFAPAFAFDFFFKKGHKIGVSEALKWSVFWVFYALVYGGFLFWAKGAELSSLYLTAFFTEKALSVDNLFVFTVIFSLFNITGKQQQTALAYGIIGAIVARVVLLTIGGGLLSAFPWAIYPLAGFLVWTGFNSFNDDDEAEPKGLAWARKYNFSPFLACILLIELNDLIFAVDSIPAVLAISSLPLVAITSNIAAIQSLRSLFFVLEALKDKLNYLGSAIALVLILIGAKMLLVEGLADLAKYKNLIIDFLNYLSTLKLHIDPLVWLAVVLGILALGVGASLFNPNTEAEGVQQ